MSIVPLAVVELLYVPLLVKVKVPLTPRWAVAVMPGQDDEEEPVTFEQYAVIRHVPTIAPPHGAKAPHWPDPLSPSHPTNTTTSTRSDFRMKLSLDR
jgi:hypothetical protein